MYYHIIRLCAFCPIPPHRTHHEAESDAHHLGRPLHVVMRQPSPLDQLLRDDIADADQRACRTTRR